MAAAAGLAEMAHDAVSVVLVRRRDGRVDYAIAAGELGDLPRYFGGGRRDHVGPHVEAVQREVDWGVNFARRFGLGGRKPLEVNDEELRGAGDGDLLGSFALALALRTLPDFVAAEHLFLAVASQAVMDVAFAGARDFDADGVEGFVRG